MFFYDLRHQLIYRRMLELYDDRDAVDTITLSERLKLWEELDQVGGIQYIASLPDAVPSADNLPSYLAICGEKTVLRSLIRAATTAVSKAYDYEGDDVSAVVDGLERDLIRISENREENQTPGIKELVQQSLADIESLKNRTVTGLSTGYPDFDSMTGGLQQGEMIVITARPSVGKTSLAMNIAEKAALDLNLPVGVFSLEMKAKALVTRMICSRSRVNLRAVREGFLSQNDMFRTAAVAGRIQKAPLYIDDSSGLSITQLRAKARRMKQRYDIKLFVIDYLQLLNAMGGRRKSDNRQQEVSDISCGIKGLAKELDVPVLVLSQLNRTLEREKNRRPRLCDLRESGSIEQDADVVGLMYRSRFNTEEEEEESGPDSVAITLDIAKARNGPTGEVALTFLKAFTRFESAAKIGPQDAPSPPEQQQQEMQGVEV